MGLVWGREADRLLYNKDGICDVKMHINVNFCLHFVKKHNTVSRAKIAKSTELMERVKQVCAGHSKQR